MTLDRDTDVAEALARMKPRSLITAPFVAIPPRAAAEVARLLRIGIWEGRRNADLPSDEIRDILRGCESLAAGVGMDMGTPVGRKELDAILDSVKDGWVAVSIAAKSVGHHRNSVYGRIRRGTLPTRRDAKGRLLVHPDDLKSA